MTEYLPVDRGMLKGKGPSKNLATLQFAQNIVNSWLSDPKTLGSKKRLSIFAGDRVLLFVGPCMI